MVRGPGFTDVIMKVTTKFFCMLLLVHFLVFWLLPMLLPRDNLTALGICLLQFSPAYILAHLIPCLTENNLFQWPTRLGCLLTVAFWILVYGLAARAMALLYLKSRRAP